MRARRRSETSAVTPIATCAAGEGLPSGCSISWSAQRAPRARCRGHRGALGSPSAKVLRMDKRIPMLIFEAADHTSFETSSQNRPCLNAGGAAANEAEVLCATCRLVHDALRVGALRAGTPKGRALAYYCQRKRGAAPLDGECRASRAHKTPGGARRLAVKRAIASAHQASAPFPRDGSRRTTLPARAQRRASSSRASCETTSNRPAAVAAHIAAARAASTASKTPPTLGGS